MERVEVCCFLSFLILERDKTLIFSNLNKFAGSFHIILVIQGKNVEPNSLSSNDEIYNVHLDSPNFKMSLPKYK